VSNQYPHCRNCFYEKTHKETQHPCSVCHDGGECLDSRIPELEAQVSDMRRVLQALADFSLFAYDEKSSHIALIANLSEIRGAAKYVLQGLPKA